MAARQASAADQTVYSAWVRGLELALSGTGWVSGGTPSAQGTPDMTVALAAGTYRISGTTYSLAGQNATITTAHATLTRQDLISVDSTGTATVTAGTAAAAPGSGVSYADPPDLPSGHIPIALVEVAAGVSSVLDARIVDIRSIIPLSKDLIDAKGDLLAGTAADTISRVAVGTDGQLLKSDSGASAGVSWATHDSTGDPHTQYPTQTEYDAHVAATAAHGATGAVVGTTNSQTLTNKTLTSPVLNTGVTGTAIGATAGLIAAGDHTTPAATATVAGHVPTPPNNTTTFLRGDATWAAADSTVKQVSTHRVDTNETTTSTSYVDLTTVGPTVTQTAELNDDFICIATVKSGHSVANARNSVAFKLDAAATDGDVNGLFYDSAATAANNTGATLTTEFLNNTAASHTIKLQYAVVDAGTGNWANRRMNIQRVTVS